MTEVKLERLYDVPTTQGADGSLWLRDLESLHLVGRTGWAVGSGQVLRTQDSGRTWSNQICRVNHGNIMTKRLFVVDQQTAWIIMVSHRAANNCYYTRDGGEEWWEKRSPALVHPDDILFFDQMRGWIISDDGDIPAGEAMIHITRDGGRTWESLELEISGAGKIEVLHSKREDQLSDESSSPLNCDDRESSKELHQRSRVIG